MDHLARWGGADKQAVTTRLCLSLVSTYGNVGCGGGDGGGGDGGGGGGGGGGAVVAHGAVAVVAGGVVVVAIAVGLFSSKASTPESFPRLPYFPPTSAAPLRSGSVGIPRPKTTVMHDTGNPPPLFAHTHFLSPVYLVCSFFVFFSCVAMWFADKWADLIGAVRPIAAS